MNGCSEFLDTKIAERNERAKKAYRYINDVARRLSEATGECRAIADLFTTSIEAQRQKLRDHSEKLFFLDPLNYGKKSLELLWRKVYYDTVSVAKKLRESDNDYDNYLFSHIVCGIGHLHHIMSRVQSEMNIDLKELDFLPLYMDMENEDKPLEKPTNEEYQFGKSVIYSCLIYLGDLSRYEVEIFNTFDSSLAARYYLQAAKLDLTSGMPFNQLGNLNLDRNHNLDSVCYYIHCLNTMTPFEGAMGNLTKIFEKNNQFCDTLHDLDCLTQSEHIQATIANFLSLIEVWYFDKDDANISKICNSIALQLKIAMNFDKTPLPDINQNYNEYTKAIEEENINPSHLNAGIIHNIVVICLFTISKLNESNEGKAFACKAFTLAFLSQVLQKLLRQLTISFGLKNPAHKYNARFASTYRQKTEQIDKGTEPKIEVIPDTNEIKVTNGVTHDPIESLIKENVSDVEINVVTNEENKGNNKKSLAKRRRRRRVASSESSDDCNADTESSALETDGSDSEDNLSDSTFQSEDESKSDGSLYDDPDDDSNVHMNGDSQDNTIIANNNVDKDSKEDTKSLNIEINGHKNEPNDCKEQIDILAIEQFLLGDNFLPSLKLLQDWILTEKDLILSCGDSGETLFQCVVDLINIFLYYFNPKYNDILKVECKILEHAKVISKKLKLEYKSIPLPEDMNLRGTNICKFDKDAAEWLITEKFKPTVIEENVIRILSFIDFGYQIAKIVPRIRFNRTLKIFYYKKIVPPKVATKMNHRKIREWHNSKNQNESNESGLLHRLGRLWLTSQVRELERTRIPEVPSLLAVDTATLYKHLRRVKQLLRTRNFIFLVPIVVLQELDELKRQQSSARDAIRWLEIQLKSGSRFLRTQRPGQSRPLPLLKYPRKAPSHIHNYVQILEFCNHFITDDQQTQGGNGDPDDSIHGKTAPLLILLVGDEQGNNDEQYKEFSLTGAAQAAGISVKYIGDFYTEWRQTIHKAGKKR